VTGDIVPIMKFDHLILLRLLRPGDAVDPDPAEADRLQDAHLSYIHDLWERGLLVAAGPAGLEDDALRGFGLLRTDIETAAKLMAQDPSVLAGRFEVELTPWMFPAGMIVAGAGAPPKSVAEARS
jgi:uncharacterized protein YciI